MASLPHDRTQADIRKLFYPESESNTEINIPELRQRDLFPTADNKVYENLYEFVLSRPDLSFPDIHSLLKTTKQEGKVMSIVMSHVSQWLNRNPTKVAERDNNKPLLRNDLVPALRERHGEKADEQSVELQNRVLEYVRDNIGEFTCPTVENYLQEYPHGDGTAYTKRFEHETWKGVLIIVLNIAGPHLQHDALLRYNAEDPRETCSKPASAIAQAVCKIVGRIPEVLQNPALNETVAMDDLRETIEPLIVRWVARQCAKALESPAEHWQPSAIKMIEAQHAKYVALVEEDMPLPALPWLPDPPEYNPPMSDGEVRGGSTHSTGSSVHESEVERPNIEGLKDGPTAGHTGALAFAYRRQAKDPFQLTPEGLQELRSLHRNRTLPRLEPWNNRPETQRVGKKEGSGSSGKKEGSRSSGKKERSKSSDMSGYTRSLQPTQPQSSTMARGPWARRKRIAAESGI